MAGTETLRQAQEQPDREPAQESSAPPPQHIPDIPGWTGSTYADSTYADKRTMGTSAAAPQVSRDDSAADRFVVDILARPQRLRMFTPALRAWALLSQRTHDQTAAGTSEQSGPLAVFTELVTVAPPAERVERPDPLRGDTRETRTARGPLRQRVGLMLGCAYSAMLPGINAAAISALTAEGCEVVLPRGQGCCGALARAAGKPAEAERFARRLATDFGAWDLDAVVTCAPVCACETQAYGEGRAQAGNHPSTSNRRNRDAQATLASQTRDLGDFLAELPPHMPRATIAARLRWYGPQRSGVNSSPRTSWTTLLRAIPGLEVIEPRDYSDSAGASGQGMAALLSPSLDAETDALRAALDEGYDALLCDDPAALLRLRMAARRVGLDMPALHPIELVSASIHGVIPPALGRRGRGVARALA